MIAIIGMACRLPGAGDPDEFWGLLRSGRSAVREIPAGRRDSAGHRAGERGGFLDDVDHFDAGFFGISPREAAAIDPQQRLVLELGWEALEDAGIVPAALADTPTGVFVGAASDDYATLLFTGGADAVTQHTMTGVHRGVIANRLSYALRLRGPSLTLDAGQSSSLLAVHLACTSLRQGESAVAVAGGVNLNLAPVGATVAARFGALSPDGQCYTFDERANGFVRGEGAGLVVLKPLDRALADGDRIYCVIEGSAANNDGGGASLTTPSEPAQRDLLARAYRAAGLDPTAVQYVELHGTGTRVGDPIEAAALGAVLGQGRPVDARLPVGSVKTNLGHLEAAAGITGLIKTALAIRHRQLPPSLNFRTANPAIPLADLGLRVQTELGPWPRPDERLVAGVSSFGMGGTNCHVVLAEAPASPADPAPSQPATWQRPPAVPVVLSGRTGPALRAQATRLHAHLLARPELDLVDIGHELAVHRTAFDHRAVLLAEDRDELLTGLTAVAQGEPARGGALGVTGDRGGLALLFSGQGSQRLGMGRELVAAFPAYAKAFAEVCAALDEHLPRPLREVVFTDAAALDQTHYTQAGLFAVEVALYRLWSTGASLPTPSPATRSASWPPPTWPGCCR